MLVIQDRIKQLQNLQHSKEQRFNELMQTYRPSRDSRRIKIVTDQLDDSILFTNSEPSLMTSRIDQKLPSRKRQ